MCGHYRKPLSWLIDTDAVILKYLLFLDCAFSVESKKKKKKKKTSYLLILLFVPPLCFLGGGGGGGGVGGRGRMEAVLGNLAVLLFLCVLVGSRLTELTNQAQKSQGLSR